ncbi:MAG: AAA family ATPase [Clostridia bacterium]|nr:AAA family ATPase [Clostridia bacterium]
MEIKILLEKDVVQVFQDALNEMRAVGFDAVSVSVFISALLERDESLLRTYLLKEGIQPEDIDDGIDDLVFEEKCLLIDLQKLDDSENNDSEEKSKDEEKEIDLESLGSDKETVNKEYKKMTSGITKSIKYTILNLESVNGENYEIPISEEFYNVWKVLTEYCKDWMITNVNLYHVLYALFESRNPTLKSFFEEELDTNFRKALRHFCSKEVFSSVEIPYQLSGFMNIINEKVDISAPCEILMRDKEVEKLWNISMKKNKRNSIIIGEPGVGKSALIEKMAYDIVSGNCPEQFKNFSVISLDVNGLIAGTMFRGEAEERIRLLIKFLEEKDNIILFIDEVHTIIGAGSCFQGEMDLSNALKPILARGETIVIGATTEKEYEKYFKEDGALNRRFEPIIVKEPKAKDIYTMIKNKIDVLSKFHKVSITREMVDYAILIANCFAFEKKNPDKTLDLIDRAMAKASSKGKSKVDKESILSNFDIYFDMYEGMDKKVRKATAYHEAGHYIVGKYSKRLVQNEYLAVSIMPAENYLGVTVYDYSDEKVPITDMKYYIDLIASELAGRVAEEMVNKHYNSGAKVDLEYATKISFDVVAKYGMGHDKLRSRAYISDDDIHNQMLLSTNSVDFIDGEMEKLIDKGYKRAKKILKKHKALLKMIADELLKNQIMSETELDKIWTSYFKGKSKR